MTKREKAKQEKADAIARAADAARVAARAENDRKMQLDLFQKWFDGRRPESDVSGYGRPVRREWSYETALEVLRSVDREMTELRATNLVWAANAEVRAAELAAMETK